MKGIRKMLFLFILPLLILTPANLWSFFPQAAENTDLDKKVLSFLKDHKYDWYDMNIPFRDGQDLYDLIIKHKYTKALEI